MAEVIKRKRGRPKGSKNKKLITRIKRKEKDNVKLVKFEVIDGKNVCPICKSQKMLECQDCSVRGDLFIFKFVCHRCDVQMLNEVTAQEL